jgi:hypothetical protein
MIMDTRLSHYILDLEDEFEDNSDSISDEELQNIIEISDSINRICIKERDRRKE